MQSKKASLVEALTNTSLGFLIAMATWRFIVCPVFGIVHDLGNNVMITTLFTAISIARGFAVRRAFEAWTRSHLFEASPTYDCEKFLGLNVKEYKRGYRWKVVDDGDVICTGTDYHKNEKCAIDEAVRYFCRPWSMSRKQEGKKDAKQT